MHLSSPAESIYLDLSDRAKLRLTGADRVRFLNGQVSNDVRRATAGNSVYTGVMTIKGRLCADAFVHAADDSLLVDTEPGLREALAARLERYIIADDVRIEDVTESLNLWHLIDFAADAGTAHLPGLRTALAGMGAGVRTVESVRYGRPGLDLFFEPALEAEMHRQLHTGFTELNDDAAEAWRIAAGVPRWGAELNENTMPAEADLEERAVSYTKGCYIGQEIVSRVKSVGHVNRHLRGLRALDSSPLYAGMVLRVPPDKDDVQSARGVGQITSAAPAAGHGGAHFIALGYVRRGWDAAGTVLDAMLAPAASPDETNPAASADMSVPTDSVSEEFPPPCRVEVCTLPFV